MKDGFKRWRIPFVGKGAINLKEFAGHHRVLGVEYTWNGTLSGWSTSRSVSFWGIVAIRFNDSRKGMLKSTKPHGFSVRFMHINFKATIKRADTYI